MSELLQPLSGSQLILLKLIAIVQRDYGKPPVWSYLEHELDKVGLDASRVLDSVPVVGRRNTGSRHYSLVWTDSNIPMPATEVRLTIAGRYRVAEFVELGLANAFIPLLNYLVTARMRITMSPVEAQTVYATRCDLRQQAPNPNASLFGPQMIGEIRLLVEREPVLMNTVSVDNEDADGWRIELRRELSLYKEIESIQQYIERVSEILTPPPPEPIEPLASPLGVVGAFDYLDVAWRLQFNEQFVVPINNERTARLTHPVNTQEELTAQLSSLGQLLKGLRISHEQRQHPVQGIVPFLEQNSSCDQIAIDRVRDAVAVFEAVIHVRNARQHGGGQERGAEAIRRLGLAYPIMDPAYAWQVIQNRIVAALTALREEILLL